MCVLVNWNKGGTQNTTVTRLLSQELNRSDISSCRFHPTDVILAANSFSSVTIFRGTNRCVSFSDWEVEQEFKDLHLKQITSLEWNVSYLSPFSVVVNCFVSILIFNLGEWDPVGCWRRGWSHHRFIISKRRNNSSNETTSDSSPLHRLESFQTRRLNYSSDSGKNRRHWCFSLWFESVHLLGKWRTKTDLGFTVYPLFHFRIARIRKSYCCGTRKHTERPKTIPVIHWNPKHRLKVSNGFLQIKLLLGWVMGLLRSVKSKKKEKQQITDILKHFNTETWVHTAHQYRKVSATLLYVCQPKILFGVGSHKLHEMEWESGIFGCSFILRPMDQGSFIRFQNKQ